MQSQSAVLDLIARWEAAKERGQPVSAEELCRDCPDLLAEVRAGIERLISVPSRSTEVWEGTDSESRAIENRKPPEIPGYEILSELGRGGMGVVYKARQLGLNRVVALKMILAGGHASQAALERFRTEAEAVAALQHTNIVQIFDIGEHEGLPYFSLEFVAGGSLTGMVRDNPLPPKEAAALIEQLARGMQAAHSGGIIHRDLKPDNVLIASDGVPKISDFGLAKNIEASDGPTPTNAIMGTPSYMAPEQASGKTDAIGPLADVWGLGAILYRILTGRPPFQAATQLETLRQVEHDDPVSPRQLQPKTPKDLDTICLKCLQKDPRRRYASAGELADDLNRWLNNKPILARPAGPAERAEKWVRRNKTLAALLALVTLVATIGTPVLSWLWLRAERSRVAELDRRKQARDYLDQMSSNVVDDLMATQKTLSSKQRDFLKEVLAAYEKFASETGDDLESRIGIANAQIRVGRIHVRLRLLPEAENDFRRACELFDRLASDFPNEPQYRNQLAQCRNDLGDLLAERGQFDVAKQILKDAAPLYELDGPDAVHDPIRQRNLMRTNSILGQIYIQLGQLDQAESAIRSAANSARVLVQESHNNADPVNSLGRTHQDLGHVLNLTGRFEQAGIEYRKAVELLTETSRSHADDPAIRVSLAQAQKELGLFLRQTGELLAAEQQLIASRICLEQVVHAYPAIADYRLKLAQTWNALAMVDSELTRHAEAEEAFSRALDFQKQIVRESSDEPEMLAELANILGNRSTCRDRARKYVEAVGDNLEAQKILEKLIHDYPELHRNKSELCRLIVNHAQRLPFYKPLNSREALPLWNKAIIMLEDLVAKFPMTPDYLDQLGQAYGGRSLLKKNPLIGQLEDGHSDARKSVEALRRVTHNFPLIYEYRRDFGYALVQTSMFPPPSADRREICREVEEGIHEFDELLKINPSDHESRRMLWQGCWNLADLQAKSGEHARSARVAERLAGSARLPQPPRDKSSRANQLFNAAVIMARCAKLAQADKTQSRQQELVTSYTNRALSLLSEAVATGFHDVERIRRKSEFDAIKTDPRFDKIISDIKNP